MDNQDLLDPQGRGVSKELQAVQEMLDLLVLQDLLDRQALLALMGSKGTRGESVSGSLVQEEKEEIQGLEARRVDLAWMGREDQQVPQG